MSRGRLIILAVQDIEKGKEIAGTLIEGAELKDLNRARAYLRECAKRHKIPTYESTHDAVAAVCALFPPSFEAPSGPPRRSASAPAYAFLLFLQISR